MPNVIDRDQGQRVIDGNRVPMGYQQITSLAAAASLTVPTAGPGPAPARMAMIQAEAQIVRWRDDGVNPTASVGMTIAAGDTLIYTGDLAAIRFIEAAASAKLNVTYFW